MEKFEGLIGHPLLRGIDFQTIKRLVENLPQRNFKKGDMIIKQGERCLEAYLLLSGKVEVFYTTEEDERVTIIFHKAPFMFGEIEIFEERPYLASVSAIEPCETMAVSKKNYLEMLHTSHQLAINAVQLLSNLLVQTARDRRVKIFGTVENLLANLLCTYASLFGEAHGKGVAVKRRINKSELSKVLGVARQSAIRAFDALVHEKAIELRGKELFIPDIKALQRRSFSFGKRGKS